MWVMSRNRLPDGKLYFIDIVRQRGLWCYDVKWEKEPFYKERIVELLMQDEEIEQLRRIANILNKLNMLTVTRG